MARTVLILGGGIGGLVTASELRRRLHHEHRIVVVEREESFVFPPSLLWLLPGDRELSQFSRPLARLARRGIEVVRGEVEAIDPARREVVAQNIARAIDGGGRSAIFDGHGACFIEAGDGKAGFGSGDFYAEPVPLVTMRQPGRLWHLGRVLFEKDWLRRWL